MLSMKFPHLFLRPEIIITFMWGWEWSGGRCDTVLRGILVFYTQHIVTISSTELNSLIKIFLMVFKIEGIVALTIKGR